MSTPAFAIATAVLVVATLLPVIRSGRWWIRGFDFPRLQLAVGSAGLLMAQLAFSPMDGPWTVAIVAANAACVLWQAWWILPYTRLMPREVEDAPADAGSRIRLMASNVLMPNRDADRLLALVREHRPDVLIAVETDAWWETRLDTLLDVLPHAIRCPLDNLYGMHLYSRLPLHEAEVRYLVEDDIPSMHATLDIDGRRLALHALHPRPPSPTEAESSQERDAELVVVGRAAKRSPIPVIVAGDLNDVAWSRTTRLFRKISGLLDPRIGRGMYNTFHARLPGLRWPLDHLFHSRHFTLVSLRRLPDVGSDHFPILVELALAPGENDADAGLDDDATAEHDAREALDGVQADEAPVPG
ncbi:endonuclease/exonuclease/phosphatase family protein [Luteimonas deserti]|uniref:Endonuclease/exonuclease/phosphatase family protein n=1 Tax=Luteimonas deserti TaxID=2752306 RepID=A0A7Z0TWY0_9GAMM|nr:endonuclease/exonuclease/phosphatase family protein [Luteimonas deserti]NYZ61220.1 endonuclease/exonuclease/phosphatase family protein [Luteimonas deserti]